MAILSFVEKETARRLFGISGGYLFSWWTERGQYNKSKTKQLILEYCGINIYEDEGYKNLSQQRCVEKIWDECSPHTVANLLSGLCEYFRFVMADSSWEQEDEIDYREIQNVITRLRANPAVELPKPDPGDFALIAADIENNINAGTPGLVIDRLHTFATHYFREICKKHGIATSNEKGENYSLTGLVGALRKWYQSESYFESEFCLIAVKQSVSIFEKYNDIRNDNSAAHPNPLLATAEAEYAVKLVADTLLFIEKIEKAEDLRQQDLPHEAPVENEDVDFDLPF